MPAFAPPPLSPPVSALRPLSRRPAILLPLVAALVLTGCVPVPQGRDFAPAGPSTLQPVTGAQAWWRAFADPQLDALMARGLTQNLSLREAEERITEAGAGIRTASGLALGADLSATRAGIVDAAYTDSRAAVLSGSWLVDLFGQNRASRAASVALRDQAVLASEAARLAVAGEIAAAYIDLRYTQEVVAFIRRSVDSRRQSRGSIGEQFDAGAATRLDVLRADQRLAVAEAQLPTLEVQADRAIFRLATLTAQSPEALRPLLNRGGAVPAARFSGARGISADAIRLRPDVQAQERLLTARAAQVGVAQAALWPSLTLAGRVTVPGTGSTTWGFGPSINLPFLSGGQNRANLTAAQSRARQAWFAWQQSVLQAAEEVQGALAAWRRDGRNVGAQQRLVAISQETLDLARSSYDLGETDFLSILDAEVELLQARQALAGAERDRALNFVRLSVATAGPVAAR